MLRRLLAANLGSSWNRNYEIKTCVTRLFGLSRRGVSDINQIHCLDLKIKIVENEKHLDLVFDHGTKMIDLESFEGTVSLLVAAGGYFHE